MQTFMTKKYYSMLAGGTLTCMATAVLTMSDTIVSGICIGEEAVAGISLVTPLYSLVSFFAMLFSLGIPIGYSRAMGSFNKSEADRVFGFGVLSSAVIGILMFLLTRIFGEAYLAFFKAEPDVHTCAMDYLSLMPYVMLLMPFQNLIFAMIFTDGDEWLSLLANITEVLTNLGFSIVLAKEFGTWGIAAGSLIGTILSILVCMIHLLRKKNSLKLGLYYSKKHLMSSVHYGLTDSGIWLFMAISSAILNKFVSVYFGPSMLVLVGVINLVRQLALFFDGIGEAITPIIGIYYSEQCYEGVKRIWRLAEKTCVAEGAFFTALCFLMAGHVPAILGITDAATARYAADGTRILSASMAAVCFIYVWTSYCLILGRIKFNLVIGALRDLILAVPLAIIGGVMFGINGMFIGITLAPFAAWLCGLLYVYKKHGRKAYPLLLNEKEKAVKSYVFEFRLAPDDIVRARDELEAVLKNHGYNKKLVVEAMLLFEETFMLIYEKNAERKSLAECTLEIYSDHIKLVGWDDGLPFDLSDEDLKIESLGSYVFSRLKKQESILSRHQIAMSFNRNMFELATDEKISLDKSETI